MHLHHAFPEVPRPVRTNSSYRAVLKGRIRVPPYSSRSLDAAVVANSSSCYSGWLLVAFDQPGMIQSGVLQGGFAVTRLDQVDLVI